MRSNLSTQSADALYARNPRTVTSYSYRQLLARYKSSLQSEERDECIRGVHHLCDHRMVRSAPKSPLLPVITEQITGSAFKAVVVAVHVHMRAIAKAGGRCGTPGAVGCEIVAQSDRARGRPPPARWVGLADAASTPWRARTRGSDKITSISRRSGWGSTPSLRSVRYTFSRASECG